jgi:chaperonin GroEL (HSP60 family)
LEEIPIQLARNAGLNAIQYLSELKMRNSKNFKLGVDCGCGEDMEVNGVFECVLGKQRVFEMATQLVIMILRIEGVIEN